MYPNSSDTPSARGQELVPVRPEPEVLEGVIVEDEPRPFHFRFVPGPVVFEPPVFTPPTAEEIRQAFQPVRRGFEVFTFWLDEAASALYKFGEAAKQAGLMAEEPPTDPRARALWMKQHRNQGPETPKNWHKL